MWTLWHSGYNAGDAGLWVVAVSGERAARILDVAGHDIVNLPGASWNRRTGRIVFASDLRQHLQHLVNVCVLDVELKERVGIGPGPFQNSAFQDKTFCRIVFECRSAMVCSQGSGCDEKTGNQREDRE